MLGTRAVVLSQEAGNGESVDQVSVQIPQLALDLGVGKSATVVVRLVYLDVPAQVVGAAVATANVTLSNALPSGRAGLPGEQQVSIAVVPPPGVDLVVMETAVRKFSTDVAGKAELPLG